MSVVIALLLFGPFTDPPPNVNSVADERAFVRTDAKGNHYYDFEDDKIEGTTEKLEETVVAEKKHKSHSSLIKIREHFIDHMIKFTKDIPL